MANGGGNHQAIITLRYSLAGKDPQGGEEVPARLIQAARDLQIAYDQHLATHSVSDGPQRRAPGNRSDSIKRVARQLRVSRDNVRAKARG